MDLLRRKSAGELASLFGALALNYDKSIRRHRFRERAQTIINNLPNTQKALLTAYTRGVNQGLMYLASAPFDYLLLQQEPTQWREEASILTIFSMYTLGILYSLAISWKRLTLISRTYLPIVFFSLHFSYGLGFIYGIIKFILKFKPSIKTNSH